MVEAPCPQPASATRAPDFQLLLDAIQRRNPTTHQVGGVIGTEEALGADEQIGIVLMPADALAGAEGFRHFRFIAQQRHEELKHARKLRRAVFHGKRERLLFRQSVAAVGRIISYIAAGAASHSRT